MSDHLSGYRALADPTIDLTDLYAFPSPSRPGHLVLVMNVFPEADPSAHFSDQANYRFRLRPVSIASRHFDVRPEEFAFTCTFASDDGTCTLPNTEAVSFRVNDERGGQGHGVRIFAGLRLDPFFMDVSREVETRKTRRIAFQAHGTNTLDGLNVLGIVLELDVAIVFGQSTGTLFAVAAESVTTGEHPTRLERLGRAEVKNILLSANGVDTVNGDVDVRDLSNQEDPFQLAPDHLDAYQARLNANLTFFDCLDGKLDWPPRSNGAHPLTELVLADFLVVDVAKPYAEESYLEIERALLTGRAHATCGGRSLNDDAIDTLYTFIVSADNGPRVSDGVDQATVRASQSYPYLAAPNTGPHEHVPQRAG
jgi:hypothetical protein